MTTMIPLSPGSLAGAALAAMLLGCGTMAEPNAKQTEPGAVMTLDDVLFDSNRAELPSGGLRDMAKLVARSLIHGNVL